MGSPPCISALPRTVICNGLAKYCALMRASSASRPLPRVHLCHVKLVCGHVQDLFVGPHHGMSWSQTPSPQDVACSFGFTVSDRARTRQLRSASLTGQGLLFQDRRLTALSVSWRRIVPSRKCQSRCRDPAPRPFSVSWCRHVSGQALLR